MKRQFTTVLIGLSAGLLSAAAMAGKPTDGDGNYNGNGAPSGPHYNLNIIGVEQEKSAKMTNSNRHTIFVPLVTKGKGVKSVKNNVGDDPEVQAPDVEIHTQIWLMPGEDFRVCDGNGFDLAYGCDDNPLGDWNTCAYVDQDPDPAVEDYVYTCGVISQKEGAVFELPCNQNLTNDQDGYIGCDTENVPYSYYEVWARANGKLDGEATITTCATIQDELQCSTENVVMTRTRGQTLYADVTDELTSAVVEYCIDYGDDDICDEFETTRIALFSGDSQDWFWNYVNEGLRLLQLRFYTITL